MCLKFLVTEVFVAFLDEGSRRETSCYKYKVEQLNIVYHVNNSGVKMKTE